MRLLFFLCFLFCLSCQNTSTPFPGANLFVDTNSRYHIFLISPPWEAAPADFVRTDIEEDPERVDFVVLSQGPLGSELPDEIPVSALSIFPPRQLGGLESAMQQRRIELEEGLIFSLPENEREFETTSGIQGREFSFLQSGVIFHREFFFVMPDGFIMRLFYGSNRDLDLPEIDFMTKTLNAGLPDTF